MAGDVDVVVLQEGHSGLGAGELDDLVEQRLSRQVGRVRLSREEELERPLLVAQQLDKPLAVAQQ